MHRMIALSSILKHSSLKRAFRYLIAALLCSIISLVVINQAIGFYVRNQIYTDINKLPYRPYGVVLGTSKYFGQNSINLFYHNRLLSTYELFSAGKVDYLLLSGDNRTHQYNEPRTMFQDLKKMGISTEFMYMDFAGFRTLDSVIRADRVFKAHSFTIITQKFHCERALFIAKYHNIDAICFVANYPQGYHFVRFREFFARLQLLWDILIEKEPHFLGQPEPLPSPVTIPIIE